MSATAIKIGGVWVSWQDGENNTSAWWGKRDGTWIQAWGGPTGAGIAHIKIAGVWRTADGNQLLP